MQNHGASDIQCYIPGVKADSAHHMPFFPVSCGGKLAIEYANKSIRSRSLSAKARKLKKEQCLSKGHF